VEPDIVVPYDSGENAADTLRKEMMSLELSWEQYEHLDSLLNELHPHREEPIPHRFRDPVKERLAWDAQLAKALELARQASP
jgi:hypothetical protein